MSRLILSAAHTRVEEQRSILLGRSLLAGTIQLGYYGEYSMTEVVDGIELAALVGVTEGNAMFSNTAGWLGFSYKGKKLLVAKKQLRSHISWNHLNGKGVVSGKTVSVQGDRFICRLLTGGNGNPSTGPGGEWDDLFSHVAADTNGNFAKLSSIDFGLGDGTTYLPGRVAICQEMIPDLPNCVMRGALGGGIMRYYDIFSTSSTVEGNGWRPVLELID